MPIDVLGATSDAPFHMLVQMREFCVSGTNGSDRLAERSRTVLCSMAV